jgi:DNA-directed RNA polymerase I, II, and III subunit RPABC2
MENSDDESITSLNKKRDEESNDSAYGSIIYSNNSAYGSNVLPDSEDMIEVYDKEESKERDGDNDDADAAEDDSEGGIDDEDDLGSLNDLLDEVTLSDLDEDEGKKKKSKKEKKVVKKAKEEEEEETYSDEEDDEEDEDNYLKKFDEQIKQNVIADYHPELNQHNYEEIEAMTTVIRNSQGMIIDPLHKTIPFLTKYEKARILGDRARQINSGAKPLVEIEAFVMDGYLIALKELEEKKIPFIIKRPLPNGGVEYWKLKDLEILV